MFNVVDLCASIRDSTLPKSAWHTPAMLSMIHNNKAEQCELQ